MLLSSSQDIPSCVRLRDYFDVPNIVYQTSTIEANGVSENGKCNSVLGVVAESKQLGAR